MTNESLAERATNLQVRYRKIQRRIRSEIRRRVGNGESIPMSEIWSAHRTLGIARSQWERMEAAAAAAKAAK